MSFLVRTYGASFRAHAMAFDTICKDGSVVTRARQL
jgi:hypothetical protein